MKRLHIALTELASFDNLTLACAKAARGKRERPEVAAFLAQADTSLASLGQRILDGEAPLGRFRSFHVLDPKRRLIHAACFEDRVLHHAILNLTLPVFERSLVSSTYACRPGMGHHAAVRRVQTHLRAYAWYFKVDVSAYFPSIDHACLKALLARRFKGAGFLALLDRVIDAYHFAPGRGLPIGSLTSQHFANLYLDGADRMLLAHPEVRAHVRYMDDIWCACDSARAAQQVVAELSAWLFAERGLRLKPDVDINRCAHGVRFCGYQVKRDAVRLTLRQRRRYVALRRHWENAWAACAATRHAGARAWRRGELRRHPFVYDDEGG